MFYKNKIYLASNLKKYRKLMGLTQSAVADALGIERSRYAHYEKNTSPSTDTLCKLAAIFSVSIDELLAAPEGGQFLYETGPNSLLESFLFTELKGDEKSLVIKYRLLSPEMKEETLKAIEEKIEKSED